jgi:hypothetical protein
VKNILGDFQPNQFYGCYTKIGLFRGFFQFGLATLQGIKKNPLDSKDPRISKLKCALPRRQTVLTFEYENVHRMKNKHDVNLLRTSYLCNEKRKKNT